MLQLLVSDETNFLLNGLVNSQNICRYAKLKSSNPEEGGRPDHFVEETPTFQKKIMVMGGT